MQLRCIARGAQLIDLAGQRFEARGKINGGFRFCSGEAVDITELFGEAVQAVFQSLGERIVGCLRIGACAGRRNGAADFVQPLIETGKLFAEDRFIRLHVLAELLDRAGDRDQLLLEHANGRIVAHAAELRLDVIETIGEGNDFILKGAGIETTQRVFHIVPAAFDPMDAVFACELVNGEA